MTALGGRTLVAACALAAACGDNAAAPGATDTVTIAAVQGSGTASPLAGTTVTVVGLVTGDFQDHDGDTASNLGGFYLKSETPDGDPRTSEGLFVYEEGREFPDVKPGDRVRVTGVVKEHFGETQLLARRVEAAGGRSDVAAVDVRLPVGTIVNADGEPVANLERYEGMLVHFPGTLTVSGLHELERFGTLVLAAGGRLVQYTNAARPDAGGFAAHRSEGAARTILLDDGLRAEYPARVPWLSSGAVRAGDAVTGLTGNLRYARGSGGAGSEGFRIMPQTRPRIRAANPRPAVPTVAGDLRIAALNVLNYFSVVDSGPPRCGPRGRDGCRGADSEEERRRQLAKIAATLAALDADVVALVELENDARDSLADIAAAANRDLEHRSPQALQYDFVATGTLGGDAIKTGLLYRPATVTPDGPHALLDARVDPRFDDRRHRPVLAQAFVHRQSAERLTVAVVHLKSKGSACDDDGDRNSGDGQGNCNGARTLAAEALIDWLARDPTGSGDPDVLLIGDFNAYVHEDPMRVFARAGWANLGTRAAGLYYTYVYDARAGALDHALASPALAPKIAGFAVWHSNADEAAIHDYNLEHGRDPAIFDAAVPWRASDHDPLLIGIGAGADYARNGTAPATAGARGAGSARQAPR